MADKLVRRWGGGTAVFSLIIWFIHTPFMATIWVLSDFVSYGLGTFSEVLWSAGLGVEMLALVVVIVATLEIEPILQKVNFPIKMGLHPHDIGNSLHLAESADNAIF